MTAASSMRIGIITFHRAYNCGAMLQAWALKTVLGRMGHVVEFPACNEVGYNPPRLMCQSIPADKKGFKRVRSFLGRLLLDFRGLRMGEKRGRFYDSFRRKYLPERVCEPYEFQKHYDLIIVGSDQVFNSDIAGKWRSLFYGETVPEGLPKIIYAGSIGDAPKTGDDLAKFKKDLESFVAVSFREPFDNFPVVLDPTLLLSAVDYRAIRKRWIGLRFRPYMYLYSIFMSEFEVRSARELARRMNCDLVISPAYPNEKTLSIPETVGVLSPERMIQYVRGARYVLAGSFHGTVFALIHHKPFLTFRNKVDEPMSRPAALLAQLGIADRCVNPNVSVDEMEHRLIKPLSDDVYCKLDELKKLSIEWLSGELGVIAGKVEERGGQWNGSCSSLEQK